MTAEQWNERYPVGTKVRYYPVLPANLNETENYTDSETRTAAWALGHGQVVVSIKGRAGGVAIEHCVIMDSTPAEQADRHL